MRDVPTDRMRTRSFLFNWGQWGCAFFINAIESLGGKYTLLYCFLYRKTTQSMFLLRWRIFATRAQPNFLEELLSDSLPNADSIMIKSMHSWPFAALFPVILLRVPINWMSLPAYPYRDFMKLHRKKMQLTASQQKFWKLCMAPYHTVFIYLPSARE